MSTKNKNTEPPKRLRKGHRRCTQSQCGHYLNGTCQPCEECKARPYEVKIDCKRCIDCEGLPGALRWEDPDAEEQAADEKIPAEIEADALRALIQAALERLKEIEGTKQAKKNRIEAIKK